MSCACTRLPRSADWSCLEGPRPDPERARLDGQCRTRLRCRETGLWWEVGYAMDRAPEPFAEIACDSLAALTRLVDAEQGDAGDAELGHAAARCGQLELAAVRLGRVLAREGTGSVHRYAWVRACRALGRWPELVRFLSDAVAGEVRDPFDLESWIHARFEQGTLGPDVLDRLRAALPRFAPRLRRAGLPLPVHSLEEPVAFCAFAPLLLRFDRGAGLAFVRDAARDCDLSLHLPFAWAFLARADGLDDAPAIRQVLERSAHLQRFAGRAWEAAWQPLFWRLWPVELHEAAAQVLVAAGARSTAQVLRNAGRAGELLVSR